VSSRNRPCANPPFANPGRLSGKELALGGVLRMVLPPKIFRKRERTDASPLLIRVEGRLDTFFVDLLRVVALLVVLLIVLFVVFFLVTRFRPEFLKDFLAFLRLIKKSRAIVWREEQI